MKNEIMQSMIDGAAEIEKLRKQRNDLIASLNEIKNLVDECSRGDISADTLFAWLDLHFNEERDSPREGSARAAIAGATGEPK